MTIADRDLSSRRLGGGFASVLALLACLWSARLFATPFPPLIDGPWLSRNADRVVVLDVRSRAEFERGHWPASRWAGFRVFDWQVERYGVPGYLPEEERLASLLGSLGLTGGESLVVVGSAERPGRVAEAARVVWSLMMAGFKQVALLDGGVESLPARDLVEGASTIDPARCTVSFRHDLLADTNRVEGLLDDNGTVIDFRPTPYFEGVKRDPAVPEAGNIRDAVGFPPERVLDDDGRRFLGPERIRRAFEHHGIPIGGPVVTFSDTGVWAALGWFALHRLLGNPRARLYDGSLVEWIDWHGEMHDGTDDMGGPIG